MRLSFFFRWYDLWIGAYYDRDNKALYICPIPTIGLYVKLAESADCAGVAMNGIIIMRRG